MSFWHKNNARFSVFRVDSKDSVLDWFTALGQVLSCWKSKPMLITNANALSAMGHSICQSWGQSLLVHKWVVCMEGFGSVYNALFPGQLHHILCIVMHNHRIWLWLNYISPLNIHSSNKSIHTVSFPLHQLQWRSAIFFDLPICADIFFLIL